MIAYTLIKGLGPIANIFMLHGVVVVVDATAGAAGMLFQHQQSAAGYLYVQEPAACELVQGQTITTDLHRIATVVQISEPEDVLTITGIIRVRRVWLVHQRPIPAFVAIHMNLAEIHDARARKDGLPHKIGGSPSHAVLAALPDEDLDLGQQIRERNTALLERQIA